MVFVLRRSAIIFAPSTFRPLLPKLQTGVEWTRQGVLTVSKRVRGGIGIPDGGEGSIRLEEVSHNLCALHLQLVTTQAAKRESNGRVRAC